MADGSVIISVSLDTTQFIHSIELLESRVSGLGGSMSSSLSGAFAGKDFYTSVENAFSNIIGNASNAAVSVKTSLTSAIDEALAYFEAAPWADAGNTAASGLASGITDSSPLITAAVSGLMTQISAAFAQGWYSIGQNIAAGIAGGITDGIQDVTNSAVNLADKTKNTLKNYYQIASPSALMRDEIGVMISRGIADGITAGSSFVSAAFSSIYGAEDFGALRGSRTQNDNSRSLTQNIYLRDGDSSPYRTAKRIKRESEAIFRI